MASGSPHSGQASFQMPSQWPKLPSLIKRVSKLLAIVDPESKAALVAADFAKLESKSLAAANSKPTPTTATAALSRRKRNPLAIVDPKSKEAVPVHSSKPISLAVVTLSASASIPVAAADQLASAQSRRTFVACRIPRRHAIAVVDPDTKQQLTHPGNAAYSGCTGAQISSIAGMNGHKQGKKVMTIVDPASKLAVLPPVKGLATSSLLRTSGLNLGSSHPRRSIRRAVTIVNPHSKQHVVLPEVTRLAWQPSSTTAIRPIQHGW